MSVIFAARRAARPALAAAIAMIAFAGCSETTVVAPSPSIAPAPPGSPPPLPEPSSTFVPDDVEPEAGGSTDFTTQTGNGTMEIVEYAWHEQGADAEAVPPEHAYLVVKLRIECTDGECYHNPASFALRADDTDSTFTGGRDGFGPLMGTGTLSAGDEVEGTVTFDAERRPSSVLFLDEFDDVAGELEVEG